MTLLMILEKIFTWRNIALAMIGLVAILALNKFDSCRGGFTDQTVTTDGTHVQRLIQDTNRLGQTVSKQAVIIVEQQEKLKQDAFEIFNLKKQDEKRIKRINALIKLKSIIHKDVTKVPYLDTIAQKRFTDSVELACADVIKYYRDSTTPVPRDVGVDSTQDADFQFKGTVTKEGLTINSVNFPDSQSIAIVETGGWFKRDINGKLKVHQKRQMEVMVLHTNKYIEVQGMSSKVYKPKANGRWLERALILAAGVYLGATTR